MKIFQTLHPSVRRNLLTLFIAGLLFWAALSAMLPVLPLYVQSLGGTGRTIGWVMGAFAIGLLGTRSSLARLADMRGRKIVLIIGVLAVAIAPFCYGLTDSFIVLVAIRAFHGISIAAFALAFSALVIDLSPPQNRGELIGYMSLVNPIGMGLGPALGGFLESQFGFNATFIAAGVLGLLGFCFTIQVKEPSRPPQTQAQPSFSFWSKLGDPRVRIPALMLLMVGLSFGALTTFVPLLVDEAQIDVNVGLFYTMAAIAGFTLRLLVGRASDFYGRGPFISISLVLFALSMAVLWGMQGTTGFLMAGLLEGAGAGTLVPMVAALMADRSTPDERGRTFSLCMVGFDLGIALAGPLLGAIATQTSYRAVFGIATLLSSLGLVVFMAFSSKNLAQSVRFALGRSPDVYAIDTMPTSMVKNP
ncbi:MFS transporter [Vacuolonema iberomarrocanum]|uniref:MFS transporter n=1 Tax=Vacuolonema iberomarrocanum TaxID=3454632 RepID=UPI001A0AB75B|nr:MFS transporter [filamentous cyanobacterium LEGE 07170]